MPQVVASTAKSNAAPSKVDLTKLDPAAAVIRALEDPRYDWRTLEGIARSVQGISGADILRVLDSMQNQIVRATSADGRTVFTTRNHYNETHGLGDKILSVLTDKVVA